MKLAILIDGGYFRAQWQAHHKTFHVPSPEDIQKSIDKIHAQVCEQHHAHNLRLLRTYYYDTEPFADTIVDPAGRLVDFSANSIAVRKGVLRFRGWQTSTVSREPTPMFSQKGVDIKIGLDVAWLATKRIVDVIVLVTGDSDFIAPMKFARTEGVEVWLYALEKKPVITLIEHADITVEGKF